MTEALIVGIVVFTLATFLGVELIHRVPPTLHTPLMSGSNAISGITVVGALIVAGGDHGWISVVIGFLAIVFAVINVVGGYAVTDRMLGMFTRERPTDGN
ncbi:NAD(P) transhydrogenase subunit alpha [soil metagenome]